MSARPMHAEDLDCPPPRAHRDNFVLHIMAGILNGKVTVEQAREVARKEQWFFYDSFHHAPLCPANHWHQQAFPSPFCTCGARARQIA